MAKILIVDEDRLFALTVVHVLSRYGHQAVLADKPSKAAGWLQQEDADLLLMEAELAGRKGLQLLKELRQFRPDVPVVLFVDRSLSPEARGQLKKGVFDYINKPFGHEELLVTVERGLERRRLVLSNKQLLSDLEQRVRELSTFNAVARTLNSTLKLKEVLDIVMTKIKDLIKAEAWSILMLDEASQELVFEVALGEKGDQIREMRLAMGQGVAGWVAQQGQPVIVPDVAKDQRFFKGMDNKTGFKTRSIIATPLISRGRLIGVFEIINKLGPEPFNQKDMGLLQTLTDHAAIAIENARLYEKAQKLAITDDLTGLSNSRHCDLFFNKALAEAKKQGRNLSVLFIDLDHMKEVDDTYGHLLGGQTLKEVADRIGALVKPPDLASRYGGDEYVIILPFKGTAEAKSLAETVRKKIEAEPFLTAHQLSCKITASIGIAVFPAHGQTMDELLSKADKAMYRVKETGKNRVQMAE
ncbi:diguanylate cyclase [candidate division TA06 bacterium]|uniref:Diguanylate cyclase n=1 Tax=candidate division TA06 bacterium TaxID=2250710 RepID=A0A933IAP8_UNCT6|nr:diguanylate cyclase [candidate division TA06 bacterium]